MQRYCQTCGNEVTNNSKNCKNCFRNTAEYKLKISKLHSGKSVSAETREKISASKIGKKRNPFSDEWKENMKLCRLGKKLSEFHKQQIRKSKQNISPETKRKLRIARINEISRDKFDGNQIFPSYNRKACEIIDEYGHRNEYNFIHAMNGGEYYIKELGYWVDGYDIEKNVVVEYYENWHNFDNFRIKGESRRIEIMEYLKCKFIIIKESGEIVIYGI
jgi:hypothetical protein